MSPYQRNLRGPISIMFGLIWGNCSANLVSPISVLHPVERLSINVVLSVAKNLCPNNTNTSRECSSPTAPQNDPFVDFSNRLPILFYRNLVTSAVSGICGTSTITSVWGTSTGPAYVINGRHESGKMGVTGGTIAACLGIAHGERPNELTGCMPLVIMS